MRKHFGMMAALLVLLSFAGAPAAQAAEASGEAPAAEATDNAQAAAGPAAQRPCGVCYEVFVYSFADSDGDGIGDLQGLQEHLDYINDGSTDIDEDLGCDMIWLMPVFPSPTYHKYDVTDYLAIDPQYGDMEDFDALVSSCHERGVRLILDLPLNHTSVDHPWFREAAGYLRGLPEGAEPAADECPYVDYYHFSRERGNGYEPLEGTGWYYEARFWSGMPDLNLDLPAVREAIADITGFWLSHGADGFRLDAVTSYYSEDKAANIDFLAWLNKAVKAQNPDAYLVGEAWADPDTYAQYYQSGIDSLFDFAFAGPEGYITQAARGSKGAAWYGKRVQQMEETIAQQSPDAVDAPFYTNHDMARSAGYYLKDDGSRAKLAQMLNLLMSGNAFLYYGEELGMRGSGKDENKRAPMQWYDDPEADGMCAGPPEMEEIEMPLGSLESQKEDPGSVYAFVRDLIHLRGRHPAIGEGRSRLEEAMSGKAVCALRRECEGETPVLLLINTSEEKQTVTLAGTEYRSWEVADSLSVSGESASKVRSHVFVPPFSAAVLTP